MFAKYNPRAARIQADADSGSGDEAGPHHRRRRRSRDASCTPSVRICWRKFAAARKRRRRGIIRLKALEKEGTLQLPMVAVNDAFCKYLFDNRYGTGQSVFDGINRTTNLVVAGKTVVVVGYGWCGKGVAMRAKGLGAKVIVTEIDAIKRGGSAYGRLHRHADERSGEDRRYLHHRNRQQDVIRGEHYEVMKDGAILLQCRTLRRRGQQAGLEAIAVNRRVVRRQHRGIRAGRTDGRFICWRKARLVNLAASDGHPAEIMDMTFALQAMGLRYVNDHYESARQQVVNVPYEIDEQVARIKLESLGIQHRYADRRARGIPR